MEIHHVDFERYAILKQDILYLIFVESENIYITINMIYKNDITINDFPIYCITPMQYITINNDIVFYKEFDRYIAQNSSALSTAIKIREYFNSM